MPTSFGNIQEGSVMKVTIRGLLDNQRVITDYHFRAGGVALPVADAYDVLEQMLDTFEGGDYACQRSLMTNAVQQVRLRAQWVYDGHTRYRERIPTLTTGSLTSTALPSINALCVRRQTKRFGPRGQGRVFMPGMPASGAAGSLLTSGYTALVQGQLDLGWLMITYPLTACTMTPCLFHGGEFPDIDDDVITFRAIDPEVSSQARRRVGRGE